MIETPSLETDIVDPNDVIDVLDYWFKATIIIKKTCCKLCRRALRRGCKRGYRR